MFFLLCILWIIDMSVVQTKYIKIWIFMHLLCIIQKFEFLCIYFESYKNLNFYVFTLHSTYIYIYIVYIEWYIIWIFLVNFLYQTKYIWMTVISNDNTFVLIYLIYGSFIDSHIIKFVSFINIIYQFIEIYIYSIIQFYQH